MQIYLLLTMVVRALIVKLLHQELQIMYLAKFQVILQLHLAESLQLLLTLLLLVLIRLVIMYHL